MFIVQTVLLNSFGVAMDSVFHRANSVTAYETVTTSLTNSTAVSFIAITLLRNGCTCIVTIFDKPIIFLLTAGSQLQGNLWIEMKMCIMLLLGKMICFVVIKKPIVF